MKSLRYHIEVPYEFPYEAHLRDYLSKAENLDFIKKGLHIYIDEQGRNGVEYVTTDAGTIDLLAESINGNMTVIELKVSRGDDYVIGQVLRYMGWVKKNLPEAKDVNGIIIASEISHKLKYAVSMVHNVELFSYKLKFEIKPDNTQI